MAVGIRIKFDGMTEEQFDAVHAKVDPENNPPNGLLFHASGPIDGGWGVIDFWESREHFDRFAQERIQPAVAEAGDSSVQPDIRDFPVHEYFPH